MSDSPHITAIVDFAADGDRAPTRRVFATPARTLRAATLAEVVPIIDAAERLAREGFWVVGYVAYDASPAFDPALVAASGGPLPLAWFAAFEAPIPSASPPTDVARRSEASPSPDPATLASAASNEEHAAGVAHIRERIAAGDVYQVNLTLPFVTTAAGSAIDCYERMRLAQGGRYAAYLDLGDARVLSASPELFLERRGTSVSSRPMKGTAPRGLHLAADAAARDALLASEKERAENVMIVDVVRNDLGRVARVGSIRVESLCAPERYPSVWQLTSTVRAEVDRTVSLSALFRALFPPASVTGAPKIRASQIIARLERAPRGVYCGAIGVIQPGGDATFNVAIRTGSTHDGLLRLHAGGGVTIDSTARDELAEVRAKVAAFTVARPRPTLFETIRVEHGVPRRLERHLARLAASADYFALPVDTERAAALARRTATTCPSAVGRLRLRVAPDGTLDAEVDALDDVGYDPLGHGLSERAGVPRLVVCADAPVDRDEVWLYHKTTYRRTYEQAASAAPRAFDVILWNREGEVTELTRANLVVELEGRRWTPPVGCGLLAGVLRGELLGSGMVEERVVRLSDLERATGLWFVNALRGWVPLRLARVDPGRGVPSRASESAQRRVP